jgi:hypothetical protein
MASLPGWGCRSSVAYTAPRGAHDLHFSSTGRPWSRENPCCVRVSVERVPGIELGWPACRSDPCGGDEVRAWYVRPRYGHMIFVSEARVGRGRAKILAV